jgi:uncharacterized membrane protein YcaP (DUF421 family)
MNPEDIKLWDWQRMLVGEVPPAFLLEIILRIAFVYIILMVSMRALGKRMSAQLTRNELAAMVSLAAAIGVPILAPDRGILPPVVIAIVVVSISRLVALMSAKNQKIEAFTHGAIDTLVKDGVMNLEAMFKTRISKERIMSQLRADNLLHLGQVRRLFMEANGTFTLVKANKVRPGLSVIPESDTEFLEQLHANGQLVCHACGNLNRHNRADEKCSNCQHHEWVAAIEDGVSQKEMIPQA